MVTSVVVVITLLKKRVAETVLINTLILTEVTLFKTRSLVKFKTLKTQFHSKVSTIK